MGVFEFHENTFLEFKGFWFLWEPAWESFRPIENVVWDGDIFAIEDRTYCADPMDTFYGYGSEKMKTLCTLLSRKYGDVPPIPVLTLPIGAPEWFRDRRVTLSHCAPRDAMSWKRMVKGNGRTCRHAPRGNKLTKRNLRSI